MAFQTTIEPGTTTMSYALVGEDRAIVGIHSQVDYASVLEVRRGVSAVSVGDQSVLMTGTGDGSASRR